MNHSSITQASDIMNYKLTVSHDLLLIPLCALLLVASSSSHRSQNTAKTTITFPYPSIPLQLISRPTNSQSTKQQTPSTTQIPTTCLTLTISLLTRVETQRRSGSLSAVVPLQLKPSIRYSCQPISHHLKSPFRWCARNNQTKLLTKYLFHAL